MAIILNGNVIDDTNPLAINGPVSQEPDAALVKVSVETLTAATDLAITFPSDCNAVHAYHTQAEPIYFKLDEAFAAVPAGGVYEEGGFFSPNVDNARKFSEDPLGAGHTLHLISTPGGVVSIEFLVLP